jgi:hypothetical protein
MIAFRPPSLFASRECFVDQAQLRDAAVLAVGEQADAQKAAVGASSASTNIRYSRPLPIKGTELLLSAEPGSVRRSLALFGDGSLPRRDQGPAPRGLQGARSHSPAP